MKDLLKNDLDKNPLFDLDEITIKYIDKDKLSKFFKEVPSGIKNYFLFQNCFNFKWPYWLYNTFSIKSKTFNTVTPFLLLNNNNRNWISSSNRNSSGRVYIDPSGMISSSVDHWSIEFWVLEKETLYRPQERISSVIQNKDLNTFLINLKWKELNFEFFESIYNVKHETEELAVELTTVLQKSNIPSYLFITVRPYDILSLGTIKSIEYNSKTRVISINDCDGIYLESKPDYILTGNAADGDIDFARRNKKISSVKCDLGMATIAFGYNLAKGKNENKLRINLAKKKNYKPVKLNYPKLKEEYTGYVMLKSKEGFKLTFCEKQIQNWIYGSKISALYFIDENISKAIDTFNSDLKSIFYITCGYNRMGFFSESLKILNLAAQFIKPKEKLDLSNILERCYLINTFSDYFKLSRDIEYIKSKYKFLREIIAPVAQYCEGIKEKKIKINKNSIENYAVLEYHVFDMILISYSFFEFSYLARCVGIFYDETKFNKESLRLEGLIADEISNLTGETHSIPAGKEEENKNDIDSDNDETIVQTSYKNEHFAYAVFAGYPFAVKSLSLEKLKTITDKISASFNENPIYFKSVGGCDTFFSIIYAINLLLVKDIRVHNIIAKLFEFGGERYVLQDFVNPKTMSGIRGEGDSKIAISAFFTLLRSLLFMDTQEKLEIFPVPKAEWFIEGSEIKIEDAPSIFGKIDIKVISTKNEVQFYFYESPKYIPPNMMINLPFPTRIIQEDDFIIKKEIGNSYLLHGWPSIIRFIKK